MASEINKLLLKRVVQARRPHLQPFHTWDTYIPSSFRVSPPVDSSDPALEYTGIHANHMMLQLPGVFGPEVRYAVPND